MKEKSKLLVILTVLISIFSFSKSIKAVSLNYTKGDKIECSAYGEIEAFAKTGSYGGTSGTVYSISGLVEAPESGTCAVDSSSAEQKLAYGTIILKGGRQQCSSEIELDKYRSGSLNVSAEQNYKIGMDNFSNVKLSANTLNFTLNGTNYISQEITISGSDFIKSFDCTVSNRNVSIVNKTDKSFKVQIAKDSVVNDINVTVNCTVKQETYTTSETFSCEGGKRLALPIVAQQRTKTLSASGSLEADKKGSIRIIRRGKNALGRSKFLKGVKFTIKNSKGKTINDKGVADENYVFVTNSNGLIELTDLELSKVASENIYTIEEISTVSGYERYKKKITVKLTKDDHSFSQTITSNTIRVKISNTDATGKKELPGAKLSIVDKKGKIIKKCVFDKENNLISYSKGKDATECTWATTDTKKIFEGMPVGKYYLIEELAPEGYTKNKTKILIEVTKDGISKKKVVMKNTLEVPVPDTLNARSALLLAVAMIDIALGIGIVTYVKKNKVEE